MSFEVVATRSGAPAVRDRATGEVMHPGGGPMVEASELYILPSRLEARLRATGEAGSPASVLVLLDVGLGAASNAIAAWGLSESLPGSARRLEIVSFDNTLEPLELALRPEHADSFGLTARTGDATAADARAAATTLLREGRHETPRTTWRLGLGDFRDRLAIEPAASADVVFWDFFSPRAHPHLWTVGAFRDLRRVCRAGATVHTYSTATAFRAAMLLAGFAVGVGGKSGDRVETTIAATELADLAEPLGERWLARLERSSAPFPDDVPDDKMARADALSRVRACPQFT